MKFSFSKLLINIFSNLLNDIRSKSNFVTRSFSESKNSKDFEI